MNHENSKTKNVWPVLGCGVGLRNAHYDHVLKYRPKIDWFEIVTENFMDSGGRPLKILEKVRENYPVVLHGTSLSIASCDPLDGKYLNRLKRLADHIEPSLVSDHLCWCGIDRDKLFDLLPLPFTEEALDLVVTRVNQVQDFLNRRFLLENVSTYLSYEHTYIPEWEFLREVARRSGCGILLDLNNIYVNAFNHLFDPNEYLENIPGDAIGYFHLAGHTDKGNFLFDTHIGPIIENVWNLYQDALKRWGKVNTLIEWDESIPEFPELEKEAERAKVFYNKTSERKNDPFPEHQISFQNKPGPTLIETQRWLKKHIQPVVREVGTPKIKLNTQRKDPGEKRLSVYADGYLGRTHEALKETFETVSHLLGEGNFLRLSDDYAKTHPSEEYNLSERGRNFASFLGNHEVTKQFPFLPDLARLEWRISRSFHAFENSEADLSLLTGLNENDWDSLQLTLKPSVSLLASPWPVFELWRARKTPVSEIKIQVENHPQKVLVYRRGFEVFCETLSEGEFFVLEQLRHEKPLGFICEELSQKEENPPLQEWFAKWVQLGLFQAAKLVTN